MAANGFTDDKDDVVGHSEETASTPLDKQSSTTRDPIMLVMFAFCRSSLILT